MLNALPPSWGPKVTAIQEAKDIEEMDIDELLGSLITHEVTMKKKEMVFHKPRKLLLFNQPIMRRKPMNNNHLN